MTVPSQEYAGLAAHSYQDLKVGQRGPNDEEKVVIDGTQYRVVEHANNPRTGYQGTIYQKVDSGEIVVAHRGTEEVWKDGIVANGAMVVARTNPQADDAIALTGRALQYARAYSSVNPPEVTVTGHSLGGTLAQVSAHYYDLRGETFNAYGAGSLDRRIPDGPNDRMINHVMAADVVSAASSHYGEVRTYTTEKEISVLRQSGYHDNRFVDFLTPDLPVVAATRSMRSHSMHNFLPVDGDGKPDKSVLQDPAARARAEDHKDAIANYRGDVERLRRVVTVGARGPVDLIEHAVDHVRGPVRPGEPARQQQVQDTQAAGHLMSYRPLDAGGAARDGAGSPQDTAWRLLEAARGGNAEELRAVTGSLQNSDAGQAWQRRVDAQAQAASQREAVQHSPAPQDAARFA
ncbi:lipase [Stenotrophomonas sp.]|uniref:lipase family protein n=1 Tax=Stenotrophomonas sp. TaxID=69392 RepID=UPI0028A2AB56|nr:lipase [Stenotrophomonas sp.]